MFLLSIHHAPCAHQFMRADVLVKHFKGLGHVKSGSSTEQYVIPFARAVAYEKIRTVWPEIILDFLKIGHKDKDMKKWCKGKSNFAQDLNALNTTTGGEVRWIVPIW